MDNKKYQMINQHSNPKIGNGKEIVFTEEMKKEVDKALLEDKSQFKDAFETISRIATKGKKK